MICVYLCAPVSTNLRYPYFERMQVLPKFISPTFEGQENAFTIGYINKIYILK